MSVQIRECKARPWSRGESWVLMDFHLEALAELFEDARVDDDGGGPCGCSPAVDRAMQWSAWEYPERVRAYGREPSMPKCAPMPATMLRAPTIVIRDRKRNETSGDTIIVNRVRYD